MLSTFDEIKITFQVRPSPKGETIKEVLDILHKSMKDWGNLESEFREGYILVDMKNFKTIITEKELMDLKRDNAITSLLRLLVSKGLILVDVLRNDFQILVISSDDSYFIELQWEEIKINDALFFKNENRFVLRVYLKNIEFEKHKKFNIVFLSAFSNDDPYLGNRSDISSDIKDELNKLIGNEVGVLTNALFDLSENNNKLAGYYLITHTNREICFNSDLKNFNIFHFIGHGEVNMGLSFEATPETMPVVYRDTNKNPIQVSDWVDKEIIGKIVEDSPFKLLIFSSCDSAKPLQNSPNMLLECVQKGIIQYGMGFQKGILSNVLPDFWRIFYETLLNKDKICSFKSIVDNEKIVESYWVARKLLAQDNMYWNSPVIYQTDAL